MNARIAKKVLFGAIRNGRPRYSMGQIREAGRVLARKWRRNHPNAVEEWLLERPYVWLAGTFAVRTTPYLT